MFSMSSANQILNIVLAASLVALVTAASMELRSQALDGSGVMKSEERISETGTEAGDAASVPLALAVMNSIPAPEAASTPVIRVAAGEEKKRAVPAEPPVPAERPAPAERAAPAVEKPKSVQAVIGGAGHAPAAPTEAKLAALPAKPGIIFEDLGRKVCIGGMLCEEQCKVEAGGCEAKPAYVLKLDRPAYLSAIQLYAHDGVGPTRRAELVVKVNGEPIGKTEVYRYGSTQTVKIGRIGQLVTVESRH
ncbi:MAG: hypothetical protein IT539_16920 [Bradyrhizobiaceae bacterium]|nr:hypothetical protein [Bradyrhizobiaceae bacterium]